MPFQHNTNQEEYAPCYASRDYDELFFTSSRDGSLGKAKDGFTGNSFTDIYWSKYDKKKKRWSKPSPFEEPMNTSDHEAAPSLTREVMNCILQDVCKTLKLSLFQLVKYIFQRKKVKIGFHQYYYLAIR